MTHVSRTASANVAGIVVAVVLGATAWPVSAQTYPSRPVRVTIPTSPGSSMDMVARVVSAKLADALGQPMVTENRAGANGFIGTEYVAKAAPDGYNVMINTSSNLIIPYYTYRKLPFDPRKDFTPVASAVESITTIAVHPSLPVSSMKELVEHVRNHPGKVAYGSPGIGSLFHLIGELLQKQSAALVHVPYKGAAPAVQAAVAGEVQLLITATNNVIPLAAAGKVKPLAVMGNKRFDALPGVPSLSEALPSMETVPGWFGFFGPAGLPQPVVQRLNAEISRAVQAPDVRPKLEAGGLNVVVKSPQEFAAQYAQTFGQMESAVRAAGLQPE
jgi:tripartite-type tricarboxylate transporter receptor subunit TctC